MRKQLKGAFCTGFSFQLNNIQFEIANLFRISTSDIELPCPHLDVAFEATIHPITDYLLEKVVLDRSSLIYLYCKVALIFSENNNIRFSAKKHNY